MIKKDLKRTVPIVTVFECPTVTLLAAKLSAASGAGHALATAAAAALRGEGRRNKAMRQQAS